MANKSWMLKPMATVRQLMARRFELNKKDIRMREAIPRIPLHRLPREKPWLGTAAKTEFCSGPVIFEESSSTGEGLFTLTESIAADKVSGSSLICEKQDKDTEKQTSSRIHS